MQRCHNILLEDVCVVTLAFEDESYDRNMTPELQEFPVGTSSERNRSSRSMPL